MNRSSLQNKKIVRYAINKGPATPITFTDSALGDELLYRLSSFNSCHVFEDID